MNQHDANIVRKMHSSGYRIDEIAYAIDCSVSSVQRCCVRDYRATAKKEQIADRIEKFFPNRSNGNSRAMVHTHNGEEYSHIDLAENYSPPEAYTEAMQEIESRVSEEMDSLSVERFIHLTVGC